MAIFKITLDFETYSECDLKKSGAYRYAMGASTEILCFAYRIDDGEIKIWYPGQPDPLDLIAVLEFGDYEFHAHNFEFEYAIFNYVCVPQFGWPNIPQASGRCSAAKAAALALPRKLEHVGAALGLIQQKDLIGHRTMLKLSKPRANGTRYTPENNLSDFLSLYTYCVQDLRTEIELDQKLIDLSPDEQKVYELDQKINARGLPIDLFSVSKAIEFIDIYSRGLTKELGEITNGEIKTHGQVAKILEFVKKTRGSITDLSAGTIETVLKTMPPSTARRVLEIRQSLSKSSTKKLQTMLAMICPDSRIRGTLLYHGASTGRASGRGIQIQNFPRGTLKPKQVDRVFELLKGEYPEFIGEFPNVLSTVSSSLRGMICAEDGMRLIAADFAAIEARVLFWLADCELGLKLYHNKEDLYCYMAEDIYGKKINKKDNPSERTLGKKIVLGAGFGLGHKKFKESCDTDGIDISEDLAKRCITKYRETFFEVPLFWKKVEVAFILAIKNKGREYKVGYLRFKFVGEFLFIKFPSGRKIAYYKPELVWQKTPWGEEKLTPRYLGIDANTKQIVREHTYSGRIAENIVQGVARDIMIEAMIRVENNNYPVIMSIHDEIVSEIPEGFGSLKEFESLMSETPTWAKGCPIDVEGFEGKRFKK